MEPWILAMLLGCDDPQSEMKQTEDSAVPADDPLPPDDSPQALPEWAIYIFMNGDNDLESYVFYDLNELEEVGSSDNVHVVVQADRSARKAIGQVQGIGRTPGGTTSPKTTTPTRSILSW